MVETKDLPGYRVGRVLDKMGLHGQDTSELFFEGVKVPVECLLGGVEGKGMHQLMHDLPYERTVIAVGAVGAMEGGIEETLKYVRERKTFGQPVWNYQNTRFKLAELAEHRARRARVLGSLHRGPGGEEARYRDGIDGQVVDHRHAAEGAR